MKNTKVYYTPKQGRFPLFITDILDICDPVLAFDKIMKEIEIAKYLKPEPSDISDFEKLVTGKITREEFQEMIKKRPQSNISFAELLG